MIDLILLAEGPKELDGGKLLAEEEGKPLYLHAFQAARQTADAMLGLRVIVVTRPGVLDEAIRAFGFNKVVVSGCRSLSEAIVAGTKAARSGASRCFLSCGRREVTGEQLTLRTAGGDWGAAHCVPPGLHSQRPPPGPDELRRRRRGGDGVCPLPAATASGPERGGGRLPAV